MTRESLHCAADSRHPIFIRQTEAGVLQVSVFRSTTRIIKLKKNIYMKKKKDVWLSWSCCQWILYLLLYRPREVQVNWVNAFASAGPSFISRWAVTKFQGVAGRQLLDDYTLIYVSLWGCICRSSIKYHLRLELKPFLFKELYKQCGWYVAMETNQLCLRLSQFRPLKPETWHLHMTFPQN